MKMEVCFHVPFFCILGIPWVFLVFLCSYDAALSMEV